MIKQDRLLAMILINQMQHQSAALKADALQKCGFGNSEIAELLGTTAASIGQQLYALRQPSKKKRKSPEK